MQRLAGPGRRLHDVGDIHGAVGETRNVRNGLIFLKRLLNCAGSRALPLNDAVDHRAWPRKRVCGEETAAVEWTGLEIALRVNNKRISINRLSEIFYNK